MAMIGEMQVPIMTGRNVRRHRRTFSRSSAHLWWSERKLLAG